MTYFSVLTNKETRHFTDFEAASAFAKSITPSHEATIALVFEPDFSTKLIEFNGK